MYMYIYMAFMYVHMYTYVDFMCVYRIWISYTADRLLTVWATREALYIWYIYICMCMYVCVCVCMYMYVWLQRVLAATYRIFCCGVWASPLVLYGLQSVDSRASCLVARPGIEPRSSALQGRFLTIRPPDLYSLFMKGKAKVVFNWKKRFQGNTSLF